jgi:hypothetical protein
MTGMPPMPPADDEVERRLRAIKEGGPADPAPEPSPPASAGDRTGAGAPPPLPGDEGPRRVSGEVIEEPGTAWTPGRGGAGPTGASGSAGKPPVSTRVVSWSVREIDAGRIGLWIGLGLVFLGGYLVFAPLFPAIKLTGSAAIAVLGIVGVIAGATGRTGSWAIYVGAVVAAAGTAGLLAGLGLIRGEGLTTIAVGLTLLGLAAWRARLRTGWRPLAAAGAIVAGLGAIEYLGWAVPGFPSLGELLLAGALVGIGWIVLRNALRPGPPRG